MGTNQPADLSSSQRIDHLEKAEAVEIAVPGHDAGDAMLAHQDGDMQVMHQVAPCFRQLVKTLPEHGRVPPRRSQHAQPGAGQQRPDEAPGRLAGPGVAINTWVGCRTQEFVADAPGQKPRRSLSTRTLDQFPARPMKFTVGIDFIWKTISSIWIYFQGRCDESVR